MALIQVHEVPGEVPVALVHEHDQVFNASASLDELNTLSHSLAHELFDIVAVGFGPKAPIPVRWEQGGHCAFELNDCSAYALELWQAPILAVRRYVDVEATALISLERAEAVQPVEQSTYLITPLS